MWLIYLALCFLELTASLGLGPVLSGGLFSGQFQACLGCTAPHVSKLLLANNLRLTRPYKAQTRKGFGGFGTGWLRPVA